MMRYISYLLASVPFIHQALAGNASCNAFTAPQILSRPFHAAGRTPGTATFTIQPDFDPVRYGTPLLGFAHSNATACFPTAYGRVSSPNSLGYASYYGWIQVIASSNTSLRADNATWAIDLLPILGTLNNPFAWYGSEPTLFDAPFDLIGDHLDWSARSFLAYLPNPALERTVVPLLGFEWGYKLKDGVPFVKELKHLHLDVWNEHLGLFRSNFTGWNFTAV